MLLDISLLFVGLIKIGNDWVYEKLYQFFILIIEVLIVIVKIEDVYFCDNIRIIFFFRDEFVWIFLLGDFLLSNVRRYKDKYIFKIGYNVLFIKIQKSGIRCLIGVLYDGIIFIVLLFVEGKNILILVMILVLKENLFFLKIFIRFNLIYFDDVVFNIFEFENGNVNDLNLLNIIDDLLIVEIILFFILVVVNKIGLIYESINKDVFYGFGF